MIRGKKVRLRAFEKEDYEFMHRIQNDEEVMSWARFRPDHMVSLEALQKEYDAELKGENALRRTFVVVDSKSGRAAGWCSLRWWRPFATTVDFGIALDREFRGKGLGTEVLELLTALAFEQYNMHKVELFTRADNKAMVRAAEKNGFRVEGRSRESMYFNGGYWDGVGMGILREEFEHSKSGDRRARGGERSG